MTNYFTIQKTRANRATMEQYEKFIIIIKDIRLWEDVEEYICDSKSVEGAIETWIEIILSKRDQENETRNNKRRFLWISTELGELVNMKYEWVLDNEKERIGSSKGEVLTRTLLQEFADMTL